MSAHKSLRGKQILPYLKNKALSCKSANCILRKHGIISVETLTCAQSPRKKHIRSEQTHTHKVTTVCFAAHAHRGIIPSEARFPLGMPTKLQWLRLGSKMSLLIVIVALALSFSPHTF